MSCNGLCVNYKATKPKKGGRYIAGQSRCDICDIYINWDGNFCPCCRQRIRKNPRIRGSKIKLRMKIHG